MIMGQSARKDKHMLTLFHAPKSRSTRVLTLLEEMGLRDKVEVRDVSITRFDGSGGRDGANLHPEGKVPALQVDGQVMTETGAIMLYLTDLFPEAGLAPRRGEAGYASYLTWMIWYGSVMEPVLVAEAAGLAHPYLTATFRGHAEVQARLSEALSRGPWLLGEAFSAADILVHSPYAWFGNTPADPVVQDWVTRCMARPARLRVLAEEEARMAA